MLFFILLIIVFIFVFLLYSFRYSSAEYKGTVGEANVAKVLSNLNNEYYIVLNDLLLKTYKGTSQIDHVVVSVYGIFVIETKNYTGWIHGKEKAEYWTQTIYSYKEKFRNPIKQNWAHIYTLKDILTDNKHILYYPIIVFTGNAELKNIYSNIPVIYDFELLDTIYDKKKSEFLSKDEIYKIAKKLSDLNNIERHEMKEHNENVLTKKIERQIKESNLICPLCNSKLVIRTGPYGEFYGCSNYPRCKFTLNY